MKILPHFLAKDLAFSINFEKIGYIKCLPIFDLL
jgi:hypothetical protein